MIRLRRSMDHLQSQHRLPLARMCPRIRRTIFPFQRPSRRLSRMPMVMRVLPHEMRREIYPRAQIPQLQHHPRGGDNLSMFRLRYRPTPTGLRHSQPLPKMGHRSFPHLFLLIRLMVLLLLRLIFIADLRLSRQTMLLRLPHVPTRHLDSSTRSALLDRQ